MRRLAAQREPLLVFIPSPLLGPSSWAPVADELRDRGWQTEVTLDVRDPARRLPCWRRTVDGVESSLRPVAAERRIVLVAHSGAGPLLPAIGAGLRQPIGAYVFVDAGLPADGSSRLEAIAAEDPAFAAQLRDTLESGRRFPTWTDEDLCDLIPDPGRRQRLLAELRPRGADFWTERLPSVKGWPNAPCTYLLFSAPYRSAADQAQRRGWPTRQLAAGHFHAVVDPSAVADALVELLVEVGAAPPVNHSPMKKGALG